MAVYGFGAERTLRKTMQPISRLNALMLKLYGPQMSADKESLRHEPLNQLGKKIEDFNKLVKRCVRSASFDKKYRWLAFVYRSSTLRQFICNQAHSLLPHADRAKFIRLQKYIFQEWYENRAEADEILSLFQMALTEEVVLGKRTPYFGFSRDASPSRDGLLYDLNRLIPVDFIGYYHQRLLNDIKSKKTSPFEVVDRHIQAASSAILSTVWGSQAATDVKCWLADATGNMSIMRRAEKAILNAILCLALVDPLWKYYYYLPYAGDENTPYAALGIACSDRCVSEDFNHLTELTWTIKPLEIVEKALKHNAEEGRNDWNKILKEAKCKQSLDAKLAEVCKLVRRELGVEARLELPNASSLDAEVSVTNWVKVPLAANANTAMIRRVFSKIEPQEISFIISFLSDAIKQIDLPLSPFDAETLELQGWLDIDLIESTRIFGNLTDVSRSDAYRLAQLLKLYFEQHLLGNRALRTNETPDGWMCGFSNIRHALSAAISLVRDLETGLNVLLRDKYPRIYHATRNGIGLRIGVHRDVVTLSKKEPLASKQDNAL